MVASVAATAAWAWWTASLQPFTWPALVAVEASGVGAMVLGARQRAPARAGGTTAAGALVWVVLATLLAGWELAAYVQQPRADHPTLSSLAEPVLAWQPVRAAAFIAWLALGARLARR